ncbi:hypothetical protein ACLK1G_18645 [Pseudomonas sp. NR3]|uniref:hypothetical protein n=1 Tax=Pseudomonas sp. NR3 TaxID=3155978 RepID=UPI003B66E996
MGVVSYFFVDEASCCRNLWAAAERCVRIVGIALVSAGRSGAHEHGVEPVVIGFVWAMVTGWLGLIQLRLAGFGRLTNDKSTSWLDEGPVGASLLAKAA